MIQQEAVHGAEMILLLLLEKPVLTQLLYMAMF